MSTPTILVSGASGLIGRALAAQEPITALHRGGSEPLSWDPLGGTVVDDGRPIGAVIGRTGREDLLHDLNHDGAGVAAEAGRDR